MRIVDAVRRAIEEDADDLWACFVKGGCAHSLHTATATSPDRNDADIVRRLVRDGVSNRAGMTHVERPDGSQRPWLLITEERRIAGEPIPGGRRITDPVREMA